MMPILAVYQGNLGLKKTDFGSQLEAVRESVTEVIESVVKEFTPFATNEAPKYVFGVHKVAPQNEAPKYVFGVHKVAPQ